jgi:hypothetical protein
MGAAHLDFAPSRWLQSLLSPTAALLNQGPSRINWSGRGFTFRAQDVETSTFPNLVGAPNQRRIITSITADEMKFTNLRTPAGVTLHFVWKRAK